MWNEFGARRPIGEERRYSKEPTVLTERFLRRELRGYDGYTAKAKGTGWQVYVWTDEKVCTWSSSVATELKKNGVGLLPITTHHLDPRLVDAYRILVSADKPNFPAASDLARYSILKTMGGVGGVSSLLETPDNTAFVTGPAAVKRALVAYVQTLFPKFDQIQAIDLVNQALVHDLPLGWVTPESDNQEH